MASVPTKIYSSRNPNNFEEEYLRSIEAKYSITVESENDLGMGEKISKLRSNKPGTENTSPRRLPVQSDHGLVARSPSKRLSLSPNGKIQSNKEINDQKKPQTTAKTSSLIRKHSDRIKGNNEKVKAQRKRKFVETDNNMTEIKDVPKRRRLNSYQKSEITEKLNKIEKLQIKTFPGPVNGIVPSEGKKPFTVSAVGKQKAPVVKYPIVEKIPPISRVTEAVLVNPVDEYSFERQNGVETFRPNNYNKFENRISAKVKKDIEMFDKNLNKISGCIRNENLQHLYEKKVLNSDIDSSPFKGKMSAFEISLLKGKQNLERRKSLESATLRSSPRTNHSNNTRPNYSDTKRAKARMSLGKTFSKDDVKRLTKTKLKKDIDNIRKRKRTISIKKEQLNASPVKMEKKIRINSPLKQPTAEQLLHSENVTSLPKFSYRMNGSKKRNSLPARLTMTALSGKQTKRQGKSTSTSSETRTSCQQFCAKAISGTPPALLHSKNVSSEESPPTFFARPSKRATRRPSSLPLKDKEKQPMYVQTSDQIVPIVKTEKDSDSNSEKTTSSTSSKNRRRALEETINMLRQSSANKSRDHSYSNSVYNKHSLSPSRSSESQSSRRSSRSTTPNMTPVKSEFLTPRSTPCSSPDKSPCGTPTSKAVVDKKKQKGRKAYLFARNDEVLARWHDGRFYLGKILQIDDEHRKCQLRYEDDSEYWSMFKDIHRVLKDDEMICCVCLGEQSEPPNEIVLCEYCLQGYHQQCHSPDISAAKIVNPNEPWFCRQCVFLRTVQVGGAVKDGKWAEELRKVKLVLPYQLKALTWDTQHKSNTEQTYCYCGGPGIWFQKMLQCCQCKQLFHEACLQCMEFPLMFGDSFYIFVCAPCNKGSEYIKRLEVEWPDVLHICLFNLGIEHKRKYYDFSDEVLPWIFENWEQLQVSQYDDLSDKEKGVNINNALKANKARFASGAEVRKKEALWGLRVRVPPRRIHVTLPINEKITDQVINKLKMKGRRSKVFMLVECKSPVKLMHSPLHPSIDRLGQNLDQDHHSPSIIPGSLSKTIMKSNVPLLDQLIPPSYTLPSPHKHPFLLDPEVVQIRSRLDSQAKIWNKNKATVEDLFEDDIVGGVMADSPPILQREEPVVPVPSCNSTPPMPEMDTADTHTKNGNRKKLGRRCSRKSKSGLAAPPDIINGDRSDKTDEISVKRVKSLENYFCAFDKTGYGKGFHVMGKRLDDNREVEYMIKWDQ